MRYFSDFTYLKKLVNEEIVRKFNLNSFVKIFLLKNQLNSRILFQLFSRASYFMKKLRPSTYRRKKNI